MLHRQPPVQTQHLFSVLDNKLMELLYSLTIEPDTAWKLFSKSLRAEQVMQHVEISGDEKLAVVALEMISVMA